MKVKEKFFLGLILGFALICRLINFSQPSNYLFDEQYHVSAAKLSLHGDPALYEWWHGAEQGVVADWLHPPLFKYVQAVFMAVFGETAFAWRLPNLIFSLLTLVAVFYFTKELFGRPKLAMLAVLLLSLDGLFLVQSRVGMNDMLLTLLGVLVAWRYLVYRKKFKLDFRKKGLDLLKLGLLLGLALATKWTALFFVSLIFGWEIFELLKGKFWHRLPWLVFTLLVVPALVYVLSFAQLFLQGKNLVYFINLHREIMWYQTHRDTNHPDQSKAIDWFLNRRKVVYWKPSAYGEAELNQGIYAFDNPVLNLAAVLSVLALLVQLFKASMDKSAKSKIKTTVSPNLFLLFFYLLSWLPWIFSPRIMFYYHYLPAVPFLMIILAGQLNNLNQILAEKLVKKLSVKLRLPGLIKKNLVLGLFIFSFFLAFSLCYPFWTGIPYRLKLLDKVYFLVIDSEHFSGNFFNKLPSGKNQNK